MKQGSKRAVGGNAMKAEEVIVQEGGVHRQECARITQIGNHRPDRSRAGTDDHMPLPRTQSVNHIRSERGDDPPERAWAELAP